MRYTLQYIIISKKYLGSGFDLLTMASVVKFSLMQLSEHVKTLANDDLIVMKVLNLPIRPCIS